MPKTHEELRAAWRKNAKKSYYKNRETIRKRRKEAYHSDLEGRRRWSKGWRKKIASYVRDIKSSNPCADCGLTYHYVVMDFDHRPGEEKLAEVGFLTTHGSFDDVKAEIEKCDLVCSNCHRLRTFERKENS